MDDDDEASFIRRARRERTIRERDDFFDDSFDDAEASIPRARSHSHRSTARRIREGGCGECSI